MHVLITVFFNAQKGGLHNNVFSTAKYLFNKGHQVTVLCKSGVFSNELISNGIDVINTEYENVEETVNQLVNCNKSFDIIHAHPFVSREVAIKYHILTNIPLFITYHGMYTDYLSKNIQYAERIITVSDSHSDYLKSYNSNFNEKFITIPNGVDRKLFKPLNRLNKFKRYKLKKDIIEDRFTVMLVTRLDPDKSFILDIFFEALKETYAIYSDTMNWVIVGDGKQLEEIRHKTDKITNEDKAFVEFVGWQDDTGLAKYYQISDLVIGPGRCALEAMACKKPIIAVGSKSYIGLITHENWKKGIYTNFGGLGDKAKGYKIGTVINDIEEVYSNRESIEKLGELGEKIVDIYYNEDTLNELLLKQYELALT